MSAFGKHVLTAAGLTWRRNIKDSRFFFAVALVLLVTGISSLLSESQARQRFRDHWARSDHFARTASLESVKLALAPAPLSFLSAGGANRLPSYLVLSPGFLDQPIEDVTSRRPIAAFRRLDWVFIVNYFFSFLTLLLTFDFLSGQRESGTLALTLSGTAPRISVLLGGLLGTLATVVPCLLAGLSLYLIPAALSGLWTPNAQGLARVAATAALSTALLTVMALAGLLSSALFRRSASSLTFAFLFWAAATLVIPQGARIAGHLLAPVQSFHDFRAEIGSERVKYLSRLASFSSMDIRDRLAGAGGEERRRRAVADFQRRITEQNSAAIEAFRRAVSRLRRDYLSRIEAREDLIRLLQGLSPAELHRFAVEDLCGVGGSGFRNFWRAAEKYSKLYTDFAKKQRAMLRQQARLEGAVITERGYSVSSVSWFDYSKVKFQRRSLPPFQQPEVRLEEAVRQALSKLFAMGLMGAALFAAAAGAFARLDP